MNTKDIIMLVIAKHIVDKITNICKRPDLREKLMICFRILNEDSMCESVISWDEIVNEALSTNGTLLMKLTGYTIDVLRCVMADILVTEYWELAAAIMVAMMRAGIVDYHMKPESGSITIELAPKTPTMKQIVEQVARFYRVEPDLILRGRTSVCFPRKVSIYLVKKLTRCSIGTLVMEFQRDESTIIYAIRRIEIELRNGNQKLQSELAQITTHLYDLM